jgi:hypothetical protein
MTKKFYRIVGILFGILLPLSFVSGCGGTPIPVATGLIYVLDHFNDAVYVLNNVATINGATNPVRTISGTDTLIQNPASLAVDTRRDILYVADNDQKAVLAFLPGSQTDGDAVPLRTYPGITTAGTMFYDLDNDVLYLSDITAKAVLAWDGISTLASGTGPTRVIGLGYFPTGMIVDTQRDLLYVGDPSTKAVKIYVNASTLAVPATPNVTFTDASEAFVKMNSLALNVPNDILFVAESNNPSLEVFDNASTLTTTPETPERTLNGTNTLLTIHLDQTIFLQNVLYVILNNVSNSIGVWNNANQLTGDVAPDRNIQVTPASEITSIAVDLAH